MKDQHTKISGYRDLTQDEIDDMNNVKRTERMCNDLIANLTMNQDYDQRSIALAKTNIQQGFMWAVRAVARPVEV